MDDTIEANESSMHLDENFIKATPNEQHSNERILSNMKTEQNIETGLTRIEEECSEGNNSNAKSMRFYKM